MRGCLRGPPPIPLMQIVSAFAEGNDAFVGYDITEEHHVFKVIVVARYRQRYDLLSRPIDEGLGLRRLVCTVLGHEAHLQKVAGCAGYLLVPRL